jgi:hypothetical protein
MGGRGKGWGLEGGEKCPKQCMYIGMNKKKKAHFQRQCILELGADEKF